MSKIQGSRWFLTGKGEGKDNPSGRNIIKMATCKNEHHMFKQQEINQLGWSAEFM